MIVSNSNPPIVSIDAKRVSNRQAMLISLAFNGYWLLCVVLQSQAFYLLALVILAALIYEKTAILAALPMALVGIATDFALSYWGLFSFQQALEQGEPLLLGSFPVWLVFLWAGFAIFAWLMRPIVLKHNILLLIAVTAFAGPSSYYAGVKLGVASLPFGLVPSLAILVLIWSVMAAVFMLWIRYLSKGVFKEHFDLT